MITYWNKNGTEILFDIEDKDVPKVQSIVQMLNTEGWKHFQAFIGQMREEIISEGKNGIKSKAKRELSPEKWATLYGFDITKDFIPNFITEVDLYLKKKKAEAQEEV